MPGLFEALGEFYADWALQRWAVHFFRNVFTATPNTKVKEVAAMLATSAGTQRGTTAQ